MSLWKVYLDMFIVGMVTQVRLLHLVVRIFELSWSLIYL